MSSKHELLRYYRENIAEVINSALELEKVSDRSKKVNKKNARFTKFKDKN